MHWDWNLRRSSRKEKSGLLDRASRKFHARAVGIGVGSATDPLELIIWEKIAYLANDKRRAEAFASLK
jgi:hypothetical protein